MLPHQAFAGRTAARLWGLPLAQRWTAEEPLDVARPHDAYRSRVKGTREVVVAAGRLTTLEIDGLRVLSPAATALTLGRELHHEHLVQVVDALLTPAKRYPELRLPREPGAACMTRAELDDFLRRCAGLSGVVALRAAAADARAGAESRFETITRLLIVEAGLPEPVVHPSVVVDGIELHPDLGYPELKIAIEYEGDGHRDEQRWGQDIDRYARLEAAGWIIVRITKADLPRRGARLVERVATALARRG
ncbi:hypothetical protein SAMN04487783_0245 [Agrococcus baldri]|uniref:DUF559 domain-containing protein n=2 Tax=Agrococcus baldri TaxID=153730 RepID=A0AA94HK39_9MICO|nr:hypothetical protein SAMN04487783_0245 [Agrococcus baldri]